MKIDSIDFVLNTNKYIDKSFYFISGNETSFIEKVKDITINYYKTKLDHSIKRAKNIESVRQTTESLFHKKELVLISDLGSFNEKSIESYENKDFVYVFILPNSPKVNTFKRNYLPLLLRAVSVIALTVFVVIYLRRRWKKTQN